MFRRRGMRKVKKPVRNASSRIARKVLSPVLLATAAIIAPALTSPAAAQEVRSYNIPAGSLTDVLNQYARQSGIALSYNAALTTNLASNGLKGGFSPVEGLSHILSGTGITYRRTGANAFTLEPAPLVQGDVVQLGTLRVQGVDSAGFGSGSRGGDDFTADSIYRDPRAVSHVDGATIERYRGQSPAEMLQGIPGVMSGEARNGAGSVDVNIRGMQGMGRVAVTIDGTMNATNVYQGYQGISNRTFVDPDLLASIDVVRGADSASYGIAGTVAMRTIDAKDLIADGRNFGIKLRGALVSNRSKPLPFGTPAGLRIGTNGIVEAAFNPERPDLFKPSDGSASAAAAYSSTSFDLVGAYAWRKEGNYHAGSHGPSVKPVNIGPVTTCMFPGTPYEFCRVDQNYYVNEGISGLRAGEMAPNTSFETQSWLAKATARFGDGHSLQLGYTHFESENGARMASLIATSGSQPTQGRFEAAESDNYSLRYRWKPEDNGLIDVKANLWLTDLEMRHPRRASHSLRSTFPSDHPVNNLPTGFRTGTDNIMWGFDISNSMALGNANLTAGLSYLHEDTKPSYLTREAEGQYTPRDGKRGEWAIFAKGDLWATDWLQLNAGLRWQHFNTLDRSDWVAAGVAPSLLPFYVPGTRTSGSSFSPTVGGVFAPFEGGQIYLNYARATRHPSVMESVSAFSMLGFRPVKPETARNFEIGANLEQTGLLGASDKGSVKFGYFRSDVKNYISRQFYLPEVIDGSTYYGMLIYNTDRALFEGLEFSARYQAGGFTADLAVNHYLKVEFCQTADTCVEKSLYADYASNQIPPKTTIDLSLSQKLFNEKLDLGGRLSYRSNRAIPHSAANAAGAALFIEQIEWRPYALIDLSATYQVTDWASVDLQVQNLTDRFYVDPLSLITVPGPGRTLRASLTLKY